MGLLKSAGFILILNFCFVATAGAEPRQCMKLFTDKPDTLLSYYENEIFSLSTSEIKKLNQKTRVDLQNEVPPQGPRAQSIRWGDIQELLGIVKHHAVVGYKAQEQYHNPEAEIGYCFGRAMYLHLLALKMGLQKESIKKIWAVGPMESTTDGVTWGYHVTLALYTPEGWIAIDPISSRPMSVESWMEIYTKKSLDSRVRFYVTGPEKQSVDIGKYDPVQLGLGLPADLDWFKNYFVDMLKAVRTESLESMGLRRLDVQESYVQPTAKKAETTSVFRTLRDFFWVP